MLDRTPRVRDAISRPWRLLRSARPIQVNTQITRFGSSVGLMSAIEIAEKSPDGMKSLFLQTNGIQCILQTKSPLIILSLLMWLKPY